MYSHIHCISVEVYAVDKLFYSKYNTVPANNASVHAVAIFVSTFTGSRVIHFIKKEELSYRSVNIQNVSSSRAANCGR